ncbi:UNVERIFIED_CONTAM: 50S ribosomal protein L21, chloroplastic [Sesamum angustifolium]|uniref:50S ribosomal protein L21, chloroplastic n=1 Tax=Sesamum angustifolium TaxID=2727405 RepID=A0AAW2L5N7_9LAMI
MAAAALSLCSSLTPKLHHRNQTPTPFSHSRINLSFLSHSLSSLTLTSRTQPALSFAPKSTDTVAEVSLSEPEAEVSLSEPEADNAATETEPAVETTEPKREEVFAVVMVGSRQYIVFPGRFIYTQRLKGANVNDKTLDKKVIVFKYKKKKNYRRNIGHRQPITRIRITSITGYQDSPAVTLE